jgi:type II secretory pathway pseudopilin PulG
VKTKEQKQPLKNGMTLVEVVIFMSLAMLVLAGSFPVINQLRTSDKVHEERLAAFLFIHKNVEEMKAQPFKTITNGFTKTTNDHYKKVDSSVLFYKGVTGTNQVEIIPSSSSDYGDYYLINIDLWWDTTVNGLPKRQNHKQETFVILPNI